MFTFPLRLQRLGMLISAALAALIFPGCIPVTWLPDSSGFVYVKPLKGGTGQLVHFDLKTKASRVIVADTGANTAWPAVSPDGKRIAVAHFKGEAKQAKTVQLTMYDFQGKQVQKSKEIAWAAAKEQSPAAQGAMVFWSPKEDMVVVTDLNSTGIYNARNDTMKVLEKALPAIHGGTPIRPDGKGFLAVTGDSDKGRLAFLDWSGAEQKLDVDNLAALMPKGKKDPQSEAAGMTFLGPLMLPSWWEGNAATVGFKRQKATYSIDTAKKSIAVSAAFAAMTKGKDDPFQDQPVHFDFAGDVSVRVTRFNEVQPNTKIKQDFSRVAIVNNKTGKEQVLIAKAPQMVMFLPSPNGNYLSLCLGGPGSIAEPSHILVVSSAGELHSKITIENPK